MKYLKKKYFLYLTLLSIIVISLCFGENFIFAKGSVVKNGETKYYSNDQFSISFDYPADWNLRELFSNDSTPFSVVLSDINPEEFQATPQKAYPDKFIVIVFRKTTDTEAAYYKNIAVSMLGDLETQNTITKSGTIQKYEGMRVHKKSEVPIKYFYAFDRYDGYLIKMETYVENKNDENEMKNMFDGILKSLKIGK
jgi:hypothetical protein